MKEPSKSMRERVADHAVQLYLFGGFGWGVASLYEDFGGAVMWPVVLVAIVATLLRSKWQQERLHAVHESVGS